jgi:hypothetical protein
MDSNKAIDLLGGTAAAARFFEVRQPTISEWRKTGFPRARLMYLRAVRPDIYEAASVTTKDQADQAERSAA